MKTTAPYQPVRPDVSLPKLEDEILAFWDDKKIFEKSLDGKDKVYSFYDGPPFATGLPHYGHLLAGVLKDIVPRYWTMRGYHVPRRFGWDCHGLPVEYEINKAHKLETRKQILEMGVAKYNALCRGIVQRYSQDWKKTVRRVGRWVDMEKPYFTMDVSFMQSVWWVFQELYKKGLIYEGYKVVPYSVGLSSPVSNFEANLNYKNVQDPAVTVRFAVHQASVAPSVASALQIENLSAKKLTILAWTTTPWTLPSNLGLAVGKDIEYSAFEQENQASPGSPAHEGSHEIFVLADALAAQVFGAEKLKGLKKLGTTTGDKLFGLKYEPLFPYFKELAAKNAFQVIRADHVTIESGTGVVHMAPAYGEEDFFACKAAGIPMVNPVDDDGMFTNEVPDFVGRRVKEADKDIIAHLKEEKKLYKQDTITHSYPYCYRSDTPLIYRAVSSWFVAVEKIKEDLIQCNADTNWVPDHLRDGRFGKWLENARDWAISRNRFWGTPLPIWKNAEGEIICVGGREELEKLSGKKVHDLHMEFVDEILIPSPTGKSPLKRIDSVLDCWFESGSMPFAQWGAPFENADKMESAYPADFIAEGLDQTRGWFYTLMVIGTALRKQAPFKNVVVNGLILAEDGKKMSKSLRNYPDPMEVLDRHGADALRLYLIDSPVVKAQELRFSETGVKEVVRRILLRWWNSYSFFVSYANIDGFVPARARGEKGKASPNLLDQWILSRLHSLIQKTETEMAAYRLYNVVPELVQFIEDLTNTYIRFNRSHFWAEGMPEDKVAAYETLYEVLFTLSKVMAPFAPFLAETVYQNLNGVLPKDARRESVHLEEFPSVDVTQIRAELEEAVRVMDAVVLLGRNQREKIQIKGKIPLNELKIIHREERVIANLKRFEGYIREELNVRKITYDPREENYVQIKAKADFKVLGKRLGAKMKAVAGAVDRLSLADILKLESGVALKVEGEEIVAAEVEIRRISQGDHPNLATHPLVSIELDPTVTEAQILEGLSREVTRKIQQARKSADFNLDDRISLTLKCGGKLLEAVKAHAEFIKKETLALDLKVTSTDAVTGEFTETSDIDGAALEVGVARLRR